MSCFARCVYCHKIAIRRCECNEALCEDHVSRHLSMHSESLRLDATYDPLSDQALRELQHAVEGVPEMFHRAITEELARANQATADLLEKLAAVSAQSAERVANLSRTFQRLSTLNQYIQAHKSLPLTNEDSWICRLHCLKAGNRWTAQEIQRETAEEFQDLLTEQELPFNLQGHSQKISAMALNRTILATGSFKQLSVWDLKTAKLLYTKPAHAHFISALAFSPSGDLLVSGSSDKTLITWDAHTGEILNTLEGSKGSNYSLAFSFNGQYLAAGGKDSVTRLWKTNSWGKPQRCTAQSKSVLSVAFSRCNRFFAAGSLDKTTAVYNQSDGSLEIRLKNKEEAVSAVQFADNMLVTGSTEGTVLIWSMMTWVLARQVSSHNNYVLTMDVSKCGNLLLTTSSDRSITVWTLDQKELLMKKKKTQATCGLFFGNCVVSNLHQANEVHVMKSITKT